MSYTYSHSSTMPAYAVGVPVDGYSPTPGGTAIIYTISATDFQLANTSGFTAAMAASASFMASVSGVSLSTASGIGDINVVGLTKTLYNSGRAAGAFTIPANYGLSGQPYTPVRSDIFVLQSTYDGVFTKE